MIIAVDIETQGLDATKYITGCIVKEKIKKPEIYREKKALWERVKELGYKEAKRGHVLNVYSHNAQFDTAGYVDIEDPHMVFFSQRPFIWTYRLTSEECDALDIPHTDGKGKEIIKFLDTWALYSLPLKDVGTLIHMPKIETPQELLQAQSQNELTQKQLQDIETYMVQDTRICLNAVLYLKELLANESIVIKRLYTRNQIAIAYVIRKLQQLPSSYTDHIFTKPETGKVFDTAYAEQTHSAYRGGRVEAFATGIHENVYYVDCNSLYPYSATKMRFPDLKSERYYREPFRQGFDYHTLFSYIGLSRCKITNVACEHGFLPIRTPMGSYYPKIGTTMIGTWTHDEIKTACENGYKLEPQSVEWSIIYDDAPNPLTTIYTDLYTKRINSENSFQAYFYKQMMNSSIGKMAQHKIGQEIVIDDVKKCEEYLVHNYTVVKGINMKYMYRKQDTSNQYRKPYYMPIIPTLINAYARIHMFMYLKQIPLTNLIYTDTDSCLYTGDYHHVFPISTKMGDFKIEHENVKTIIYGRKTYAIGDEIKIAGITKRDLTLDDFETGYVTSKRMVTLKSTKDITKIGTFVDETRNLKTQEQHHTEILEQLEQQDILIDYDITDISYFM